MSLVNSTLYPAHVCLTVKSESEWSTQNPILMAGEIAVCTQCSDDKTLTGFSNGSPVYSSNSSTRVRLKAGDGVTRWQALPFIDHVTADNLLTLAANTAQKLYDLESRLSAAEALIAQYESLAESMLLHLNSLTKKLEQEEGFN